MTWLPKTSLLAAPMLAAAVMLAAAPAVAAPVALPRDAMPISKFWLRTRVKTPAELQPETAVPRAALVPKPVASAKIDLNTAGLEQLQNLPGVGPSMGAHIMAGRPYRNFDDLLRDGVPQSTVDQIRPLVTMSQ